MPHVPVERFPHIEPAMDFDILAIDLRKFNEYMRLSTHPLKAGGDHPQDAMPYRKQTTFCHRNSQSLPLLCDYATVTAA
jgi:hypothetical protein